MDIFKVNEYVGSVYEIVFLRNNEETRNDLKRLERAKETSDDLFKRLTKTEKKIALKLLSIEWVE